MSGTTLKMPVFMETLNKPPGFAIIIQDLITRLSMKERYKEGYRERIIGS